MTFILSYSHSTSTVLTEHNLYRYCNAIVISLSIVRVWKYDGDSSYVTSGAIPRQTSPRADEINNDVNELKAGFGVTGTTGSSLS